MKKVLSILITIAMVFALVACSNAGPDDTVSNYLDSYKNGDLEEIDKYFLDSADSDEAEIIDNEDPEVDAAMENAYSKLTYEILDTNIDGDSAIVETEITAPNLGIVMTELIQEAMPLALASAFSEDEDDDDMDALMNTMLIDKLNSEDLPMNTKTVDINLVKENENWLIDVDHALLDAMTGNMSALDDAFMLEETEATAEEVDEGQLGKRSNPVPLGEWIEFEDVYYESFESWDEIEARLKVRILEVIRGETAYDQLVAENEFNEPAHEGHEWVIAHLEIEMLEGDEDAPYLVSPFINVISSTGSEVPQDDYGTLEGNEFGYVDLFPGGTHSGRLSFYVPVDDDSLFVYESNLGSGFYFSIRE